MIARVCDCDCRCETRWPRAATEKWYALDCGWMLTEEADFCPFCAEYCDPILDWWERNNPRVLAEQAARAVEQAAIYKAEREAREKIRTRIVEEEGRPPIPEDFLSDEDKAALEAWWATARPQQPVDWAHLHPGPLRWMA